MNENTIADISVKITQIIKENINSSSQEILRKCLNNIPEITFDVNATIDLFIVLAEKLKIAYNDVFDIIDQLKYKVKTAASDVSRSSWLHTIATALYIIASIAANFLPPAWKDASKAVISGYEALYGG